MDDGIVQIGKRAALRFRVASRKPLPDQGFADRGELPCRVLQWKEMKFVGIFEGCFVDCACRGARSRQVCQRLAGSRGITWIGTELHGLARNYMDWHAITWIGVESHGIARCSKLRKFVSGGTSLMRRARLSSHEPVDFPFASPLAASRKPAACRERLDCRDHIDCCEPVARPKSVIRRERAARRKPVAVF
jgi:hypothetical protein